MLNVVKNSNGLKLLYSSLPSDNTNQLAYWKQIYKDLINLGSDIANGKYAQFLQSELEKFKRITLAHDIKAASDILKKLK